MSYPVILKNGVIAFSLLQAKPNDLPMEIPLEALFTRMGFVIPMNASSLHVLDFIDFGDTPCLEQPGAFRGLILSASGRLREFNIGFDVFEETGEGKLSKTSTPIPWDANSMYVRASRSGEDEHLTAYGSVSATAEEAITLYCKSYNCIQRGYLYVHLHDIMSELKRRDLTNEFVVKHKGYLDLAGEVTGTQKKLDQAIERIMSDKGML